MMSIVAVPNAAWRNAGVTTGTIYLAEVKAKEEVVSRSERPRCAAWRIAGFTTGTIYLAKVTAEEEIVGRSECPRCRSHD
jgi:hypothetical protein